MDRWTLRSGIAFVDDGDGPRLGAGNMIALVMTGQVLGSLALDNFGLFGLTTQPLSMERCVAGALLLMAATLMR
jgi:bacterial/archaeal transporter family-2 protein